MGTYSAIGGLLGSYFGGPTGGGVGSTIGGFIDQGNQPAGQAEAMKQLDQGDPQNVKYVKWVAAFHPEQFADVWTGDYNVYKWRSAWEAFARSGGDPFNADVDADMVFQAPGGAENDPTGTNGGGGQPPPAPKNLKPNVFVRLWEWWKALPMGWRIAAGIAIPGGTLILLWLLFKGVAMMFKKRRSYGRRH